MEGNIIQWNTMLSFPMKCTSRVSLSFQYFSQSLVSSLVAEMYPMGASNHTYRTLPSAFGKGTFTPQSRSRVMARGCKPWLNHDLHCPNTLDFQSVWELIYSSIWGCNLSKGRNQFLVSLNTGFSPLKAD